MKSENSAQLVILLVLLLISSSLVRKGRADPLSSTLQPRQRIRPLTLEWLDPVMAIIVVGPVLAHELNLSAWHMLTGLAGISLGIPIGLLRSRVQFVRAVPTSKSVVLTRSRAEYLLVILLAVLRTAENTIRQNHSTLLTLLLAALLSLPVGESITRSISITSKYQSSVGESPMHGLSA
jgi:hypothetical protein